MTVADMVALRALFGDSTTGLGCLYQWREAFRFAGFAIAEVDHVLAAAEGTFSDFLLASRHASYWGCVVRLKNGQYGGLLARPIGWQGWNGMVSSSTLVRDTLGRLILFAPELVQRLGSRGYCFAHEDCLENETLARACGAAAITEQKESA